MAGQPAAIRGYTCPMCGALPQFVCRTASGKPTVRLDCHTARWDLWYKDDSATWNDRRPLFIKVGK